MKIFKKCLLLSVLCFCLFARASDLKHETGGIQIYSDLGYLSSESEFYGLQVVLIPDFFGGKILWRSADGHINPPILLNGQLLNGKIRVTIPEGNDDSGEWVLSFRGDQMIAEGPRGLHFEMHRLKISK
jgi:hypothetical protein